MRNLRYWLTDTRRALVCRLWGHRPMRVWPDFCGRCGENV